MSDFSALIGQGLGMLGAITGQTLQYRSGTSGSWTTITGGFLTYGMVVPIGYDDDRREILGPATARLKVPAGTTPKLLPNTPSQGTYYVRVGGVTVWAVVGLQDVDFAQIIYELRRDEVIEGRAQQQGAV